MSRKFLTPIQLPADPTLALEAVTKQYVDARAGSEVEINVSDPIGTNPNAELWYDTDAPAILTDDMRWNTAWGVVGVGSFTFGDGVAGGVGADATQPMTVQTVAGRRYRVSMALRAITTAAGNASNSVTLYDNGAVYTDRYVQIIGGVPYSNINVEWLLAPSAGSHTYKIVWGGAAGTTLYSSGGHFYIEDIGPVSGAVPAPNPTPAWINLTLLNSWATDPGAQTPQYRLMGDKVEFRGSMALGGSWPSTTTPFILPAGYRPPAMQRVSVPAMQSGVGGIWIVRGDMNTDGSLLLSSSAPSGLTAAAVFLAGLSFSVTP